MTNEHPTEEPAPGIVERARLAAQKALMAHTCIYQVDADGDNLLLVDALSRGDTIADGRREIEYLAEDIAGAVAEAFAGGALLDLNTGHWWGVRAAEITDLKAKLAEAELEIVNHDHAEWAKRDRIKASDALNAVTQERAGLTTLIVNLLVCSVRFYWKKRVKEADDASE